MTLDIFARVQVSLVFSKTSYTIKTKINHFIKEYMAICWVTNTITLYNIPVHFIALYSYTHNRFRKRDILTSVASHAVSQFMDFYIVSSFDSLYDKIYRMVIENCQEFLSCALEISSFHHRAMVFCVTGDRTF